MEEDRKEVPDKQEEEKRETSEEQGKKKEISEEKTKIEEEDEEPQQPDPTIPVDSEPKKTNSKPKKKKTHMEMGKTKFSISIIVIAAMFFAAGFVTSGSSVATPDVTGHMTANVATIQAVDFVNDYLLQPGVTAELTDFSESSGVYEFNMSFKSDQGDMEYTSYVTKDGKYLFTNAVDMSENMDAEPADAPPQDTETPSGPTSDKPVVDIFIMSYCPYGLQMQKAALPAMELLGDKADINIRFVYYIMHDMMEIEENNRQYCIQKEQSDKLVDYLKCFTLIDDTDTCRATAGIDDTMMDACIAAADTEFGITAAYDDTASWLSGRFPLYNVDKELNELYSVGGSPTVVINGQVASVSRAPEAFKQAVCNAFITPPEECDTVLSSETSSPGIGGGTGTTDDADCAT